MLIGNASYYVLLGVAIALVLGGFGAIKLWQLTWSAYRGRYAAAVLAILGGALGGLALYFKSVEVVETRERGGRIEAETLHLVGTARVMMNDRPVEITATDGTCWIINHTDSNLQVESFVYSESSFPNYSDPDVIAPHSVKQVHADQIDHIGPGDRPPSSISSKSGFEIRYWLTW